MSFKRALFVVLVSLCLLLPWCAGAQEIVYVNDLVTSDEEIEVRFLNTEENDKTDATLLLCKGEAGMQVVIIDGGLANGRCQEELLRLREEILRANGLEGELSNSAYKLRLLLLATHCHKDHVAELHKNIIPCNLFEIEALYLPEKTELIANGTYDDSKNGDLVQRPKLLEAMQLYAPNAPITIVNWAEPVEFDLLTGHVKLYPALKDYGLTDNAMFLRQVYKGNIRANTPTYVVNSNCMWVRVSLQNVSVLFPGDTMKRENRDDEPFDEMIAAYGEELRSDIVKYPHHGILRTTAAEPLTEHLYREGGIVVLTTKGASTDAGMALARLGTPFVTTENGSYTFIMDAEGYRLLEK